MVEMVEVVEAPGPDASSVGGWSRRELSEKQPAQEHHRAQAHESVSGDTNGRRVRKSKGLGLTSSSLGAPFLSNYPVPYVSNDPCACFLPLPSFETNEEPPAR